MPFIQINNCNFYYEIHGAGAETIVLAHGLLWSGDMFHKQLEHLKDRYRIVTYDHRGQGRSEVTVGGYDMDSQYEDAVALIEQLGQGSVHFGGLSMGGFIGMRIAARRPDLLRSLILMETSAQPEPNTFKYGILNTLVKLFGVSAVTGPVMKIMFGEKFLQDPARREERAIWRANLERNPKTIVRAVTGVLQRKGVEEEIQRIQCPTLILVGTQDKATTPEKAAFIHGRIPGSILRHIEGAGHTACVEEPEAYNREIDAFLASV
ncbi:MAG: alpha/beta fold hydrolase [Saprospiraceae bacterium]|nr:alpha/beta fold hydrolase [Saprospiraceae bacterium]